MSRKEKSLNVRQPCRYKSLWNMKVMLLCWWICSISVCKGLNGPSNHRLSFTKSSSSLLNFSNVSTEIPSLSTHYSLISSEQQSRILQQQQQLPTIPEDAQIFNLEKAKMAKAQAFIDANNL